MLEERGVRQMHVPALTSALASEIVPADRWVCTVAVTGAVSAQVCATDLDVRFAWLAVLGLLDRFPVSN